MQTIPKSLLQPRILSRSSDPYIKLSTRSLRHPIDILNATISKIWLLFSIPKLYLLVLCMSVNGPFTLLPKEKPGCRSPCHSSAFLVSKQPLSAVSVPLKYYYTNIYPLPLSTLIIINLMQDIISPPECCNQLQPRSSCYLVSFSLLLGKLYNLSSKSNFMSRLRGHY